MRNKIKQLQQQAETLEPPAEERDKLTRKVFQYSERFLRNLDDKKAYVQPDKSGNSFQTFSEESQAIDELLTNLKKDVDTEGLNPASPGHLAYIPGGGIYPAALSDYLAAVTNRYAGVAFAGPGAVRLENECIRWLCDLTGYPASSGGNLTSSGSMANLIALVNARDCSGIVSRSFDKTVIYTTRQVHHSLMKAVKFAGLADAHLRIIEMDNRFRMKPEALDEQINNDRRKGLKPLVIFASAGTTDAGAVDPLQQIGEIAQINEVWFHVDAAYGGMFLLTKHGKKIMKGIKLADSVTIDPHKGLFLPYGTGALLVKDVKKLYDSQHMAANYLQDTYQKGDDLSPADLSPELSKHFRGLRMWLPLKLFGIASFRAALNEKLMLARYFYNEIQKVENIETGPEPQLSITYFRYNPPGGNANEFNKKLIDEIHQDGRVFLSSTEIDKKVYIRLAVLSFRTHLKTIDLAISVLKEKIAKLTGQ